MNGIPHQRLTSAATRALQSPYYLRTYQQIPRTPKNMLIVGAGTGTDVALALRAGGRSTSTRSRSTRRCCASAASTTRTTSTATPGSRAHVNDGRAFLQRTHTKYDLIVFALPDSLTLVSGASSLRLESYLFTEQAMRAARSHLAPGGAFSMYNFYRQQWLVDRLAGHAADGLRPRAVRLPGPVRDPPRGDDGRADGRRPGLRRRVGATRLDAGTGHRRPAVPVPRTPPASRRCTSPRCR